MDKTKKSRGMTTIQVSYEIRDALKDRGKKGESYDEVIKKLLKK